MTSKMNTTACKLLLTLVVLILAAGGTGCDELLWGPYSNLYGYAWPATGLYDPTADIQSVIDYRQDVMDWSNDAWDEYIRQ